MITVIEDNKVVSWNAEHIKVGFSYKDMPKMIDMISGVLYSNKHSCIAEIVQNATDIHKEMGIKEKAIIGFNIDATGEYIYIQDFGSGISRKMVDEILSQAGASTKNNTNNLHGGKGIGITKYCCIFTEN